MREGRLRRWKADVTPDIEIELPLSQITMLAFGGSSLDTIFVTTIYMMLDEAGRRAQPLLGGLYACKAPVKGCVEPEFASFGN